MSIMTTKQMIVDYLVEKTELYGLDCLQFFTTKRISYELNVSRSLTSQYLNELCKEEVLIKISSRPVYYFYKKGLEKKYSTELNEIEFYNITDLINSLTKEKIKKDVFHDVIGYDGSLYNCISQMKSAMAYPPNGLPFILQGDKNLENEQLIDNLFKYCQKKKFISSEAKIVKIEVHLDELQKLEEVLFNTTSTSILSKVNGGIVYIANAHLMNKSLQRKLANYLTETKKQLDPNKKARVILGVETGTYDELEDKLRTSIPLVCNISPWRQRNVYEREQYILNYFKNEEKRLHCPIRITNTLFNTLMDYEFPGNINEVENTIRTICANAWMDHEESDVLDVSLMHIPTNIPINNSTRMNIKTKLDDSFMIDDKKNMKSSERMLNFFDQLLNLYVTYQENHLMFNDFCSQGIELLREYYDFIVFEYQYDEEKLRKMEDTMNQVLKSIKNQYQINLPLNCSFILTRIVCKFSNKHMVIHQWENQRRSDINSCLRSLMEHLPAETMIAKEMSRSLLTNMDISLSQGNLIFLILNIHFYNRDIKHQDICGLIVAHGYSTATSIAEACNQLLQTHVFKAIDMPLDTKVEQIIIQIQDFIKLYPYYKNMILMVDMGSLTEIGKYLNVDMNIGVINNISTGLALEVGNSILRQLDIETILKDACKKAQSKYQIIDRQKKEKIIVFTSDAGIKVSKRMVELFQNSLMKSIDLRFVEYDYDSLSRNKEKDILFERYDVALIVKPYILDLENIPSMSLEDIVSFRKMERLHNVLQEYMSEDEIEIFNQNLLKNFSLQNVMESITILNPSRLMDNVSDAVNYLQRLMNRKFHSKTIAGIYIHISFLMERLVTKNAIETHEDLSQFIEEQQQFIEYVNISFETMIKHYNVELPISEIACLYDYILHDEKERGGK